MTNFKNDINNIPNTLYKYRDWDDENHKRLLIECELYFPSFDQFNDPFDGAIPFRYDPKYLTEDNIFLKYYKMAKEAHPTWNDNDIHVECYKYQTKEYLKNDKHLEELSKELHQEMNEKFGIICLSEKSDEHLMWSHYSNKHTGFCIGFNSRLLLNQLDKEIDFENTKYQDDIPLLNISEDHTEHYRKLIYTKSSVWSYEKEWRLIKYNFARRKLKLSKETIEEIILGFKMNHSTKLEILEFVKNNLPKTKIYEIRLNNHYFKLDVLQIWGDESYPIRLN